jgi:hypothetical protein
MLLRVDEAIEKSLGRQLATRPNLLTLLELYLAELEQRTMFASCFLVGETPSNVHRLLHSSGRAWRTDATAREGRSSPGGSQADTQHSISN